MRRVAAHSLVAVLTRAYTSRAHGAPDMTKLVRRLVFLVLIVVIAVFAVGLVIDSIAKNAIEEGGTAAFGTRTELGTAKIGLIAGTAVLEDLKVANPDGFSAEPFLSLGKTETVITFSSLTKDVIELPRLRLSGTRINIEQRGGGSNYGAIIDALKRFEGGAKSDASAEKRFVIRELVIEDTSVSLNLLPIAGSLTKT